MRSRPIILPHISKLSVAHVRLFTDYARKNEQQQSMVLRLDQSGDEFSIGKIET